MPLERLKYTMNKFNYNSAAAVVAWCEWTKSSIVNDYNVPDERVFVIPPGVDLERFASSREERSRESTHILFVGGDFRRKGGEHLLNVFRRLPPGSSTHLHLVTGSPVQADIPKLHVYRGLTQKDATLQELFKKADIFVLPTLGDAAPIVLMEAAAAGLPVIASNVGGIPSLVASGSSAILVKPGDEDELEAALLDLIRNEKKRQLMSIAAVEHARLHFDAKNNARRTLDLALSFV